MIITAEDALSFIQKHKIVTLSNTPNFPSLINEIVDKPFTGSWRNHPKGDQIYMISEELSDSPKILTTKLVFGKVTYIHNSIWPSLYKVVTDPNWRERAIKKLDPLDKKILDELNSKKKLRFDELYHDWDIKGIKIQRKELKKSRIVLETSLLVHSEQFHTDRGYHTIKIKLWEDWVSDKVKQASEKIDFNRAMAILLQYCNDLKLEFFL